MENKTLFMQKLININSINLSKISDNDYLEIFNASKEAQFKLINDLIENVKIIQYELNTNEKSALIINSEINICDFIEKNHNLTMKLNSYYKEVEIAINTYNSLFTSSDDEKIIFNF